jgi:hypothetical protein
MGSGREFDADGVAGDDRSAALDDAHDPGLADEYAVRVAGDRDLEQA